MVSAGTSEAEIAAMMNLGSHGLTAGVYSADRDFARRILRQLDVGTVYARRSAARAFVRVRRLC